MPDEVFDTYSVPIVAVVVEGPTDGQYLYEPLEAFYRSKYGSTCRIAKIRDVTSDPNVLDSNFLNELENRIEDELSNSKNKIDSNVAVMIREIVHIIDIDEAFIEDSLIVEDLEKDDFYYTREGIRFNSVNSVISRNRRKAQRVKILVKTKELTIFERTIPYSIYFFSVNIDDFHFDDSLNLTDDEKARKSALLRRQYLTKSKLGRIKMFRRLFKNINPVDFPHSFDGSWDYIQKDNNSLKRCSNSILIIGDDGEE